LVGIAEGCMERYSLTMEEYVETWKSGAKKLIDSGNNIDLLRHPPKIIDGKLVICDSEEYGE
jgi:hypothetical protein